MSYDYVFYFEGRQLEIVTDTISDALEHLHYTEPRLLFSHLIYFINMETGQRTPLFNTKKIYLDELEMV